MPENHRLKIILDNLAVCKEFDEWLSTWEQEFLLSMLENTETTPLAQISSKQFNTLQDIAFSLPRRAWRGQIVE